MRNLLCAFVVLFVVSCAPLDELLEEGDYETVIDRGISRVERKPNDAHTKELIIRAITKANQLDQARIDNYTETEEPEQWLAAYNLYRSMDNRRQKTRLLDLPGEPKDYRYEVAETGLNAAQLFYQRAHGTVAKASSREDYQKAFYDFRKARNLVDSLPGIDSLVLDSRARGMKNVIFELKDNPGFPVPLVAEREFDKIDLSKLIEKDPWMAFHHHYEAGVHYDYVLSLEVNQLNPGREKTNRTKYTVRKEIVTGYTYAKDANGNVIKDSNGKPVKTPKKERVTAQVKEYNQHKELKLGGLFTILDANTGHTLLSKQMVVSEVFDNTYAKYSGDKRALSNAVKLKVGNKPKKFPSNEKMIQGAASRMNSNIQFWLLLNRKVFE